MVHRIDLNLERTLVLGHAIPSFRSAVAGKPPGERKCWYENTVRFSIRLLQSTRLNRCFSLLNRPPPGGRWVQDTRRSCTEYRPSQR